MQNIKQLCNLLRRQHRRRLVEDQKIRTTVQYLDDLDRLTAALGAMTSVTKAVQ